MSTVKSLNTYFKIAGIDKDIALLHTGSDDWFSLVTDLVWPNRNVDIDDYGCVFVHTNDSEILHIWGVSTYVPHDTSHAELIYSHRAHYAPRERWTAEIMQAGYMDSETTTFHNRRDALKYLISECELTLSAAKELVRYGEVNLHENNSNQYVSEEHSLWYANVNLVN